ncbi:MULTISPECIES: GNAT family N-acetyltransferase [unclassified Ruegeria]|uniref:GNAT family N-acetyltransferase n=1 Tax=unclassified Ruegeria TaxID=2625375 RepID=UPI0014895A99|nr:MULTISPECIES: GNAT family N-acetyltransferase [unclassified Ruegeria]NOD48093.1 GNAT family N-acetyltransferase [Ruegeria sp. HKCCD5849]NOD53454.1 GNAT family N-acetyltransferase [Ruegeria sp. HKCCD5851]NOD70068.1 GNAT family N-acetyltransferase [Ruegeria sp. HKCCD7303]NOE35893.1 GNAT family N-acetyltransferase [Ruegeria sp. HKCCD7318]
MITRLTGSEFDAALDDLTEILHTCVHDGASIGFILPFTQEDARYYWQQNVRPGVNAGALEIFAAYDGPRVVGTAQLIPAAMPNQPHRADVAKLLVHPNARRRGYGRALMETLFQRARDLHRSTLVLDTRSTDPSRLLYESLGFQIVGEIPKYCQNPFEPRLEPTTYMYKDLSA